MTQSKYEDLYMKMVPSDTEEVHTYKKLLLLQAFLCTLVDQGVHHFFFISDKHIVKQIKTSMLQNNIYKIYLLYTMIF